MSILNKCGMLAFLFVTFNTIANAHILSENECKAFSEDMAVVALARDSEIPKDKLTEAMMSHVNEIAYLQDEEDIERNLRLIEAIYNSKLTPEEIFNRLASQCIKESNVGRT